MRPPSNMVMMHQKRAERLIREVFDMGTGSAHELALEENFLMDPDTWLNTDDATLKALQYTDPNDNLKNLVVGHFHKFRIYH